MGLSPYWVHSLRAFQTSIGEAPSALGNMVVMISLAWTSLRFVWPAYLMSWLAFCSVILFSNSFLVLSILNPMGGRYSLAVP